MGAIYDYFNFWFNVYIKSSSGWFNFFVWVVRYQNIVEEFRTYGLPIWLRNLVGILKLSFLIMLFSNDLSIVIFGSLGIGGLMFGALFTHLRI